MATKSYRCQVDSLTIRTQPQLGDQFKTFQYLKLNDTVNVDESTRTTASGFVWVKHDRGWSAERSLDGKVVYLLDASLTPRERMWGINIDPYNPAGNPQASRLSGAGWVRFVFHAASHKQTPDQAFAYYDPIIRGHVQAGTRILLVIIQDTYAGNRPWVNGGWDSFIPGYADALGQIARHYRGQVSAYEIWNEQDLSGQPTSIYVPPEVYGPLLQAAALAVKQADPAAKVISGGLASGDYSYLTKARDKLGGILPIDGLGWHPYNQTPPDAPVFPSWSRGSLGAGISKLADTFPGIPIWITEYGVPSVDVNNTSFWPPIANYMLKTFQLFHSAYFYNVPVAIWFAWTDSMDQAGIVHDNQQPKGPIFDTFFQNLRVDQPAYVRAADTPYNGSVLLAHVAGQLVGEKSIGELAQHVTASSPNARSLLVVTSTGSAWTGHSDNKPGMAINGPSDLSNWVQTLLKYRLGLHAWHNLVGQDPAELNLITQIALAPGVGSLVLDLDPSRLALKTSDQIRTFMIQIRRSLPANYHLGVSFPGRVDQFQAVNLPEWFPFISSWHPKIFHWQFSSGTQGPQTYVSAVFEALKSFPKPVIPMLQAEPTGGKPVPPDQIQAAAKLSLETYGAPAVSFWRLGVIGPTEFGAIEAVTVPYTAGLAAAPAHANILTVQTLTPLRIRSTPSLMADIVGVLQPGEQITVLESQVIGSIVWVRHSRGWSVSRNGQTGEIYLA